MVHGPRSTHLYHRKHGAKHRIEDCQHGSAPQHIDRHNAAMALNRGKIETLQVGAITPCSAQSSFSTSQSTAPTLTIPLESTVEGQPSGRQI